MPKQAVKPANDTPAQRETKTPEEVVAQAKAAEKARRRQLKKFHSGNRNTDGYTSFSELDPDRNSVTASMADAPPPSTPKSPTLSFATIKRTVTGLLSLNADADESSAQTSSTNQ